MIILYIDPGTGSMLFTILIGITAAVFFSLQKLWLKFKLLLTGGRIKKNNDKIPYLIFSDHKRYWNVFKPICDEFEKRKVPLEYWTASPDDPALDAKYEYIKSTFIGEGNKAFAKLNLMNVGICLSTTPGLDVYQWKRSKNTDWYVHIGHGVGDVSGYRMFGLDFYDTVFLTGGYQEEEIRTLEKMRNLPPKELPLAGLSYMDAMKTRYEQMNHAVNKTLEENDLTVLLAPSWGKSSILSRFGKEIIECLLRTGYQIIIRPHPQSLTSDKEIIETLQRQFPESKQLKWNFDNDNFEVLFQSNIMISDFSGVIFDYSLIFDRPVIYADTSYDRSPYDSYWLSDRKMWIFEALPKIGIPLDQKDFPNLKEVIDGAVHDDRLRIGREEVRSSGWQNVGHCAETVTDYMIRRQKDLLSAEEGGKNDGYQKR